MTDLSKIESLAKMKSDLKKLTAEVKDLEAEILGEQDAPVEKIKTSYGVLTLTTRPNVKCVDNHRAAEKIGTKKFIEYASLSMTGAKKAVGEADVEEMFGKGIFVTTSVSRYYTLKQ